MRGLHRRRGPLPRIKARKPREFVALVIAPWLERPEPPNMLDLRGGPPITEDAARSMGGAWMLEMRARGRPVADHVTILYAGPEGLRPDGSGYRVTCITFEEAAAR